MIMTKILRIVQLTKKSSTYSPYQISINTNARSVNNHVMCIRGLELNTVVKTEKGTWRRSTQYPTCCLSCPTEASETHDKDDDDDTSSSFAVQDVYLLPRRWWDWWIILWSDPKSKYQVLEKSYQAARLMIGISIRWNQCIIIVIVIQIIKTTQ